MKALILKRKRLLGDICLALLLTVLFALDAFSAVENRLQDSLYQKPGNVDSYIAVVGIDDRSLEELGRFQNWDRQIMADAINILNSDPDYKPAVIAVDISYFEESDDKEADENLAKAATAGGNVVMVSAANFGLNEQRQRAALQHIQPYPPLNEAASHGLANAIFDAGGMIRSALIQADYQGQTLYSFPYVIYQKYAEYLGLEAENAFSDQYEAYITYYGEPGDYSQGISFCDIFSEDFEPAYFADCVVLIGPYASGMMDSYHTTVNRDTEMFGVEIHANVLQMILENNLKVRLGQSADTAIFSAALLLALLLARRLDIRLLLAVFAALSGGYVFLALRLFDKGYILGLIYPIFALALIYIYRLIYGYILETLEKAKVRSAFKKYVDPKLVDKLMETGEANSDEVGVKKNIAVLFVDIRGFTPMTEALKDQPDLVIKILNEYLELTSTAVFNNGGSVDKFIGDATMALFNGFVPLEDYVYQAVKAACDIVAGAAQINASLKEKYGVDVGFGVGVNCGDAIVGNLGPSFRKDYTAIGDTVNTAARLESNAQRSQVLISRAVYDQIAERVEASSVGEIPLKGKSIKIEVFSVTGLR